jgi:hypothetical protein
MDESAWMTCEDPFALLALARFRYVCNNCSAAGQGWSNPCKTCNTWNTLREGYSPRKWRLIACACCRFAWAQLEDDRQRHAVEVAERFAEGLADAAALWQAWYRTYSAGAAASTRWPGRGGAADAVRHVLARLADLHLAQATSADDLEEVEARHRRGLCGAIRDVIGNPYRPAVTIEPAWLAANGGLGRAIVEGIEAEGRFDEVPVLGDALEDAGCADPVILTHARRQRHYRGCWLIDAVLGKS